MKSNRTKTTFADFLPRCYLPLLVIMTAGYCLTSLSAGVDFWAHAAVGRWIIEHRQIPGHTLFLWSADVPWVWHSWLSQIIFYELLAHVPENTGAVLAMLVTAIAAIVSLLLWWKVWLDNQRKLNAGNIPSWPMIGIFMLVIFAAHGRFHPRPEIFSAVLLTIILWLIIRGIASWRTLVGIFFLFVLWANLHAGLITGLAVLAFTACCNWVQDRCWRTARWELGAACTAVAAVFINPYGWHYWTALKGINGMTFSFIDEWKPFWKYPVLDTPTLIAVFLCVLAALAAWLFSEHRRWSHLGWILGAAVMFLMARRNLWILAQITLAVIACNPRLYCGKPWLFPHLRGRIAVCCCLIVAAIGAQSSQFWQGYPVSPHVPAQAAAYLQRMAPGHRIYNNYEISSYLEWKLNGSPPLFIDLLNAYPSKIMREYIAINDGLLRTKTLLKKWNIDIIILPTPQHNDRAFRLTQWLNLNYPWKLVYSDSGNTIWRKLPAKSSPPHS